MEPVQLKLTLFGYNVMEDSRAKDYEVTLQELRSEIITVADELSGKYKEKTALIDDLSDLGKQLEGAEQLLEDTKKETENQKELAKVEKKSLEIEKTRHQNVLSKIKEDCKEATRELNHLNLWIVKAKDLRKEKEVELSNLDSQIEEKRELAFGLFALKDEIAGLEKRRNEAILETKGAEDLAKDRIEQLNKEILDLSLKVSSLNEEAEKASVRKKNLDDEAELRLQDLEVYTNRIRNAWDKVFPGVNMPILSKHPK